MSDGILCCIDAREPAGARNDHLTLNLQGRPVFAHAVDVALDADRFERICLVTDSAHIAHLAQELYHGQVTVCNDFPDDLHGPVCVINGHAVMLTVTVLQSACDIFAPPYGLFTVISRRAVCFAGPQPHAAFLGSESLCPANIFAFYPYWPPRPDMELMCPFEIGSAHALVVHSQNSFELALVLKRKQQNQVLLKRSIQARLQEKGPEFSAQPSIPAICFVGHSQLDDWDIRQLGSYAVLNCGIRGISSFEYYDYILCKGLLRCHADIFLIMHGTNDIVYDYSIEQIVESIDKNISYIQEAYPSARILFVPCLHVNGRADRSNQQIDILDHTLLQAFNDRVESIDVSAFDDPFGELDLRYTRDGLHLNDAGYALLRKLVESVL